MLVDQHQLILPMTKQLTTIVTDAEFKGPKENIRWSGINEDAMHAMFDMLGAARARRERWFSLQPGY